MLRFAGHNGLRVVPKIHHTETGEEMIKLFLGLVCAVFAALGGWATYHTVAIQLEEESSNQKFDRSLSIVAWTWTVVFAVLANALEPRLTKVLITFIALIGLLGFCGLAYWGAVLVRAEVSKQDSKDIRLGRIGLSCVMVAVSCAGVFLLAGATLSLTP